MADTPFWDFSLQFYAHDGVEELCLQLQDDFHIDVNMALFCCWYGVTRGLVPDGLWEPLLKQGGTWNTQVVQPLRQSRRWMKANPPTIENLEFSTLRERIKALELNAELVQHQLLESVVENSAAKQPTAAKAKMSVIEMIEANFAQYLKKSKINDQHAQDVFLGLAKRSTQAQS